MSSTSAYREFTGKSVEEALRLAREAFGVGLDDLDFEILTPGSRGVLGMGAEPARVLAAPRSLLGGAAPKRDAAASKPLPPPPPRERDDDRRGFGRERAGFGDRDRDRDRGPRPDDRGPRREGPPRDARGAVALSESEEAEVSAARGSVAAERAELEAAEASPEALAAGKVILEKLLEHMGFDVKVDVESGETSRLNV